MRAKAVLRNDTKKGGCLYENHGQVVDCRRELWPGTVLHLCLKRLSGVERKGDDCKGCDGP